MKNRIPIAAAFIAASAAFQGPRIASAQMTRVHTIELQSSRDIADAAAANAALSALVQAAMACPLSNMKLRMTCVCGHKREVASLNTAYARAVLRHPAWKAPNTAVSYRDPNNGHWVGTVFSNLKRQVELCPQS